MIFLKLVAFTTTLAAILLGNHATTSEAACASPRVRPEWKQMSSQAQSQYLQAVKNLQAKKDSGQTTDPTRMSYGDFVAAHVVNVGFAHGNAQFLPFHRAMMKMWELALNANGYPGAAPYWDWATDASGWLEKAGFFNSADIGGLASPSDPYQCVPDGPFSYPSYKIDIPDLPVNVALARKGCDPNAADYDRCNHCLRRCGDPSVGLYDAFGMQQVLQGATSFDILRAGDLGGLHANVHIYVGGQGCSMADGAWSPHALEFYFHHMMVDKIWKKWTEMCPESFVHDYGGQLNQNDPAGLTSTDGILNAHDYEQIDAWPFKVSDVLDTTNDLMCYTYSKTASDIPLKLNGDCPPPTSTTTTKSTSTATATAKPQETWAQDILQMMLPNVDSGLTAESLGVFKSKVGGAGNGGSNGGGGSSGSEQSSSLSKRLQLEMIKMDHTADVMIAMLQGRHIVQRKPATESVKSHHHHHHQRDSAKLSNIHGFVPNQGYGTYVRIKDQIFDIPEGYKIYSLSTTKAVLIPIDMNRNRSSLNIAEAGDFSKAIVHVYQHPPPKQYIRPASFVAPDPNNDTHVTYPGQPQKWWTDMMGMDFNLVMKGWVELQEAIDLCNNQVGGCRQSPRHPEHQSWLREVSMGQ
ncbi:hypothetical protein HDU76_008365 [Blyttiomyces sp. JEL0837]|nr:hypothetical protein HDU76_008365 [Blyttiomyces sp. JEL0837]